MKIDTAFRKILAFLGSKKKDYQLYMEAEGDGGGGVCSLDKITKKKGVRNAEANQIGDKRVLRQLRKASSTVVSYRKLESRRHVISLIKQKKTVSNSFDNSAYYRTCGLCNIPFNTTLKDENICKSVDCERAQLFIDVWYGILNKA